jgi:MFS family permease
VIRFFPESVARARSHAARFPRPYWFLLAGEAVQSLGFGIAVPYMTLYLTGPVGITATQTGVMMLIWALVSLAGQPLGGVLADRIGRRPVMIGGLAGAGVSAAGLAFVSSFSQVIVVTVAWGLFNSVFEPAAGAYVADVVEPGLRTEAFGLWRVMANAGFAVGPPVGALVIWLSSMRTAYLLTGVAILVFLVIAFRALPETRPEPGAGEPPARFREALRDRVLVVLALGTAVATFTYAYFEEALPVFLHEERGLAVVTWGLVLGINPILVTVFQYPIARWAARRSSRMVLAAGAVLQGAALLLLLPFTSIGALVVAVVVLAAGEMLIAPVSSAVAAEIAPERLRGSYQGVINLAWEGAWGPAALIGLWLVGRGQGEIFLALALPIGGFAALLYLMLPGGRLQREPVVAAIEPVRP